LQRVADPAHALERVHVVVVEGDGRGSEVLLEVRDAGRARDQQDVRGAPGGGRAVADAAEQTSA
jgi:hypothetical protein